jgi:hypothetical protein
MVLTKEGVRTFRTVDLSVLSLEIAYEQKPGRLEESLARRIDKVLSQVHVSCPESCSQAL